MRFNCTKIECLISVIMSFKQRINRLISEVVQDYNREKAALFSISKEMSASSNDLCGLEPWSEIKVIIKK